MKLLIKFPTRQRREKFFAVLDKYYTLLDDIQNTCFVISCDEDDAEMNNDDVRNRLKKYRNLEVFFGNSKTKIEAVNADVPTYGWDILLLASDDMIPQMQGYDTIIRNKMRLHFPDLDGVLWFSDGFQKEKLNTLCILGSKYYERFHYIYNPVYVTWWCDNEFMEVANMLGKQKYFDQVIIKHEHPDNMHQPYDELYRKNNVHAFDRQIFAKRRQNNFYLKKLLIIQPGRFGDIIITLPIAEYYSQNYIVEWLCPKEYHSIFRNIDYVKPVTVRSVRYDMEVDMSFGFGGKPQQWWGLNKETFFSFVEAKYFLAGVNPEKRWQLKWKRNTEREDRLYDLIIGKYGKDYILIQDNTHNFFLPIELKEKNIVKFEPVEDFNVFDWYKVIINAIDIHCIDSYLSNYIEVVPEFNILRKTIYITKREKFYFLRSIYRNGWNKV